MPQLIIPCPQSPRNASGLAGPFHTVCQTTAILGLRTYFVSLTKPSSARLFLCFPQQGRVHSERCFPISGPGTGLKPGDRSQSLQLVCQSEEGGGFPAQVGHGHLQRTTAHLCPPSNSPQLLLPPATTCSLTQQSSR